MRSNDKKYIIVSYNGIFQERTNSLLENSIGYQLKTNKEHNIKVVLVSLKRVICNNNRANVKMMITHFEKLSKALDVSIDFVDYSMELYSVLKRLTMQTKMRLFKNISIANLFLDPASCKKGTRVLLFDKDEINSIQLSKELAKRDYSVIRAKEINEFQVRLNVVSEYDIVITHTSLNKFYTTAVVSSSLLLSKQLILNLALIMDTTVTTISAFTGLESEKISHAVKPFDQSLKDSTHICAIMKFDGDFDALFILIFPRDITALALKSLFNDEVDENNTVVLQDGVGEFCNIIIGAIKTALSKKDIAIDFKVPQTYSSIEKAMGEIGTNNGIWLDMKLAEKPFSIFITK